LFATLDSGSSVVLQTNEINALKVSETGSVTVKGDTFALDVAATFSSQSSLLAWVWTTDPAGDPKVPVW